MHIETGAPTALRGLRITGGNQSIGAGSNRGSAKSITMNGGDITGNQAQLGGGIFNSAATTITLNGENFSGNIPNNRVNVTGC